MMTENGYSVPDYSGAITPEFKSRVLTAYRDYKADKESLKNSVIENYKWYARQHGMRFSSSENKPISTTEYIFNAVENKYTDALDNYPEVCVLEREATDADAAEALSKILPVQLEFSNFKKAYKENWRRKMKGGTGIYFVDYDSDSEEIVIKSVNLLAFFSDFNVSNIQESSFVFVTRAEDNEELKLRYPEYSACFEGDCNIETVEGIKKLSDRTEIVDCYYKKAIVDDEGRIKNVVHMMKLAGEVIIDATEDIPGYDGGLYNHGKYPFVLDIMYPIEDCPFGFGLIDVVKGIQEYIDKIDECVEKNTILASKARYVVKENAGINTEDLADFSKEIITASGGNLEEVIRELQLKGLPAYITNYRDRKIEELKEIIGNRDFQHGGNAGGVTSGSAIELLQRSGEKMSRATVDDSYDAYREICIMVIDLMRQFFHEERIYRITGDSGEKEFISITGDDLMAKDALGFPDDSKPTCFDVSITAQKSNPYTKQGNNQTMTQLWELGVFAPQNLESSIILIKNMQFDGKEKLIQDMQTKLEEFKQQQMQMQQQMMQQQMMQQPVQPPMPPPQPIQPQSEETVAIPLG